MQRPNRGVNGRELEQSVTLNRAAAEKVARPFSKRTSEPACKRNPETHLRPIDGLPRYEAVCEVAERNLQTATADFRLGGKRPSQLDYLGV